MSMFDPNDPNAPYDPTFSNLLPPVSPSQLPGYSPMGQPNLLGQAPGSGPAQPGQPPAVNLLDPTPVGTAPPAPPVGTLLNGPDSPASAGIAAPGAIGQPTPPGPPKSFGQQFATNIQSRLQSAVNPIMHPFSAGGVLGPASPSTPQQMAANRNNVMNMAAAGANSARAAAVQGGVSGPGGPHRLTTPISQIGVVPNFLQMQQQLGRPLTSSEMFALSQGATGG